MATAAEEPGEKEDGWRMRLVAGAELEREAPNLYYLLTNAHVQ